MTYIPVPRSWANDKTLIANGLLGDNLRIYTNECSDIDEFTNAALNTAQTDGCGVIQNTSTTLGIKTSGGLVRSVAAHMVTIRGKIPNATGFTGSQMGLFGFYNSANTRFFAAGVRRAISTVNFYALGDGLTDTTLGVAIDNAWHDWHFLFDGSLYKVRLDTGSWITVPIATSVTDEMWYPLAFTDNAAGAIVMDSLHVART